MAGTDQTPDPKPQVRPFFTKGFQPVEGYNASTAPAIQLNEGGTKYKGSTEFSDPFFSGGDPNLTPTTKQSLMEGAIDQVQPWYDKLGNGVVKFAGSFADGVLSVPGTFWGLGLAATGHGIDSVWNNVFTKAGQDLQDSINKNFINYRSMDEQTASAWSPKNWMTWNFMADNILGNLGYSAAAWATGFGVSKLMTGLAPWIAGSRVGEALDIVKTSGVDALSEMKHLSRALNTWDRIQQGVSIGIAAASEASTEAYNSYSTLKQQLHDKLLTKYGNESAIPKEELDRAEEDAKSAGNNVYGWNIPILAGIDFLQWGKSLLGFKSEFKAAADASFKFKTPEGLLGGYTEQEAKSGFKAALGRGIKATGEAMKDNLSEAFQEGAQYMVSQGQQNYYNRKFDKNAAGYADDMMQAYSDAFHSLMTTQEGVANILGGFMTPLAMPHGWHSMKEAIFAKDASHVKDYQLSLLNGLDAKENLKNAFLSIVRHASIQQDFQAAVKDGNEYEARNLHNDLIKNYVQSRIEAGRADLLQNEIQQMKKMSKEDFATFLGVPQDTDIDHHKVLDQYAEKAKDMMKAYSAIDRIFLPALYKVAPDKMDEAKENMAGYKEMAWSYMMDAKDSDERVGLLRKEVDQGLGGVVSLNNILGEKSNDKKLNSLINQYNTLAIEHEVKKKTDPAYENRDEARVNDATLNAIKYKVNKYVSEHKQSLGLPEYLTKGNPEFMEEYLFDVEKQLDALKGDTIFNKGLIGGKSEIVDVDQLTTKLDDLRKLDQRRMLAVAAYNNLRSVIKSGEFTALKVRNPDYDPKDPSKGEEFIDNQQLLKSNHYNKFDEERENYRNQKRQKAQQEKANGEQYLNTLNSQMTHDENNQSPEAKQFREAYNKHYYGTQEKQGLKDMPDAQFLESHADLQGEIERDNLTGKYRADTGERLNKFNHGAYIDRAARMSAHNDVLDEKHKQMQEALSDQAKQNGQSYHAIYDEQGRDKAEEFYNHTINEFRKQGYDRDSIDVLKSEMDNARKDLGVIKDESDEIRQAPSGQRVEDQADLNPQTQEGDIETSPDVPQAAGEQKAPEQTQSEPGIILTAQTAEEVTTEMLNNEKRPVTDVYLTARRSDLENAINTFFPIKTVDKLNVGDLVKVKDSDEPVHVLSMDKGVTVQGEDKTKITYSDAEFNKLMQDGDIKKGYRGNVFDGEGNVKTKKYFNPDLIDPNSDMHLSEGREIRLKRVDVRDGHPVVKLQVKVGSEYRDSKISYSLDPAGVAQQFGHDVDVKVIAAIQQELKEVAAIVKTKGYVDAVITNQNTGFGSFVFNEGTRGNREARGIDKSFSIPFINAPGKTGTMYLGFIRSDVNKGAKIVQSTENGNIVAIDNKSDVYVPQSAIDAITSSSKLGKSGKAGQYVAVLPTGKTYQDKQVYLPVLLNTRNLSADRSSIHTRADGSQMNLGEAVVDVLLNPGDERNRQAIEKLFGYVGLPYDPSNPNYEAFYNNANIHKIVDSIFFASGKSVQSGVYTRPFAIYAETTDTVDGKDRSTRVTVDITRNANTSLRKTQAKAIIYITKKDGTLNTNSVDSRIQDYLYNAQNKEGLNQQLNYDSILDAVKDKPYRVDGKLASKPAEQTKGYKAIVFDDKGNIDVKGYDSYLHYLDDKQILSSTVQGIQSGKNRFYMVNAPIAFNRIETKANANEVEQTEATVKKRSTEAQKEGISTEEPDQITKLFGPKDDIKVTATISTEKKAETFSTLQNIFNAGIKTNEKGEVISGSNEKAEKASGVEGVHTSFGSKLKDFKNKPGKKGLIDFTKVKSVNQFTIEGLDNEVSAISKEISKELTDMLLEDFNRGQLRTYDRNALKKNLVRRLISNRDRMIYRQQGMLNENGKSVLPQAMVLGDHIEAINFALEYFDMNDFDKLAATGSMTAEQHKDIVSTYDEQGNRQYFVGFFNMALNELFKSKIVDVQSSTREVLEFLDTDSLNYSRRFDDGWSFKVDPRETLGKYSRIVLSTIPRLEFNQEGNLEPAVSPMGTQERVPYESAYKALISNTVNMPEDKFFEFLENIPVDDSHSKNPILRSVGARLQEIKDRYGWDSYVQTVRQLGNALMLQQANQRVFDMDVKPGKNASMKIYDLSRQMINDEVLSIWSRNMGDQIGQGKYVSNFRTNDKETGTNVTAYEMKLHEYKGNKYELPELVKEKLKDAFDKPTNKEVYQSVAEVYIKDMGFPLTSDGTIDGTAAVLKVWDQQSKGKNKKGKVFQRYFNQLREYDNLQDMVQDTLVNNIAIPIRNAVTAGTFNIEEPLKGSTTTLNIYAKALKGNFQDVVNANVSDITGNTRYIYIPRNNLSQIANRMNDPEFLWQMANTSYGRYMPGLTEVFEKNDKGEYIGPNAINAEALNKWERMELDYINGIRRNNFLTQEAKGAKVGGWDLISLAAFQNDEEYTQRKGRGQGLYTLVFGDASVAPYYKADKYIVEADMSRYGNFTLKGEVRNKMFQIFKSEVNRSFQAAMKFKALDKGAKAQRLEQIKQQLRPGTHYMVKDGVAFMGSNVGIYNFGEEIFDRMMGVNSPLFITKEVGGQRMVTGIRKEVGSRGKLNDAYLQQTFDNFIDDFTNRLIDAKMDQLKPLMSDFLQIKTQTDEAGKTFVTSGKFPLFSTNYVSSVMKGLIGQDRIKVDGVPLADQYSKDVMNREGRNEYRDEEDAKRNSYFARLFRVMIADQQLNHFIFKAQWSALNYTDPANYQKDGKTDYKSFQDNYDKRMRGLVTPKLTPVVTPGTKVRIISYVDPKMSDTKREFTREEQQKLTPIQKKLLNFIKEELPEHHSIKEDGTVTIPHRIIDHQLEAIFALNEDLWNPEAKASPQTRASLVKQMREYLNAKVTDGFTAITLREYLKRRQQEGGIRSKEDFDELYRYYSDPDLKLSPDDYNTKLPLQALKYVKTGGKIEGGEQVRLYGKDAEFVLFPALTKDTHWDDIRKHMEEYESDSDEGGVILAPLSSMKMGAIAPITLFNEKGDYTGAVKDKAVVDEWPREVLGKQIQNPDKKMNKVTAATQLDKYIHVGLPAGTKFAEDQFQFPIKDKSVTDEQINDALDNERMSEATMLSIQKRNQEIKKEKGEDQEQKTRHGVFDLEMMRMKFQTKSEQMRRDLTSLMKDWGLTYVAGGPEYKAAIQGVGLSENSSLKELQEKMNDEDATVREKAYLAYKLRNQVTVDYIDKLLSSVKNDIMQRKGLTINNIYDLKVADDNPAILDMPLTFSPIGGQIQSVMLSRINDIINGRKLPGNGFAQMPSFGFGKNAIEGSTGLKGYTAKYDDEGHFTGLNSAEIALPWRFLDKTGKLLDYDKYVNSDGSPKPSMFDPEMLKVIGLRIPNTGHNTAGHFQVVKFTRGFKDVAQVPAEIAAQMNADFDFDKLSTYIYHHDIDEKTGKITKIQGYLHHRQIGAADFLESPEAKRNAARYLLERDDPEFFKVASETTEAVNELVNQGIDNIMERYNKDLDDDDKWNKEDIMRLSDEEKLDLLKPWLSKEVYDKTKDELDYIQERLNEKAGEFNLDDFGHIPNALQILQSDKQLDNALIDSYHMMLNNNDVAKKMLKPLTTEWINNQVNGKLYDKYGTMVSLRDLQQNKTFRSPAAEVTASDTRVSNAGADEMIGIAANGKTTIFYAQKADLALGEGPAIYFGDKKGKAIQEEAYQRSVFPVTNKAYKETEKKDIMKHSQYGDVPYRLGRLLVRDEVGNRMPINDVWDSILQAGLDNQTDPLLGSAGISREVANESLLMTMLGYVDHQIPFFNQPAIRDYVRIMQSIGGVTSDTMSRSTAIQTLLEQYADKAGINYEDVQKNLANELEREPSTQEVLEHILTESGDMAPLTVAEMKKNIAEGGNTAPFYNRQLQALLMFLRIKQRADKLFTIQQALSVEAKGFNDTSIVGVNDQLTKFNQLSKMKGIINVDRLIDNRGEQFNTVLAKRYGLDTVRDLFKYGKQGVFSDLNDGYRVSSAMVLDMNRKEDVNTKKRVNTAMTQFVLSDPSLYGDLLKSIMKGPFETAVDVREQMMKENYETVQEGDKKRYDVRSNAAETVAGLLNKMQKEKDSDGIPYTERYEIMANLRAIQQRNNDNPSVVLYSNANNYKQRLDVLMAKSLVQMMEDPNPEIQRLAKMLMIYPYMVGGTNNPISYINHVPREVLYKHGVGAAIRESIATLDNAMKKLEEENQAAVKKEGDDRFKWEQILSGDYINVNKEALNIVRNFVTQYYQHNPYELRSIVDSSDVKSNEDENGTYSIKSSDYLVTAFSEKNKPTLYIRNEDGSYSNIDTITKRYNVSQYAFNSQELGETRSLTGYDSSGEEKVLNGIEAPEENPIARLPYRVASPKSLPNDKLNGTKNTIVSGLDWVSKHTDHMIGEGLSPAQVNVYNQYKTLADYLKSKVDPELNYVINTALKVNGTEAAASMNHTEDGAPTSIEYNPNNLHKGANPLFHFKTALLHETGHAVTSKVITTMQRVADGELTDKDAAKLLGVTMADYKLQKMGFDRLKAMLNDRDVRNKIKKGLIDTYIQAYTKDKEYISDKAVKAAVANATYAINDIHEFVAFAFADRAFRSVLNKIDYNAAGKKKSILQRIMDLFAEILGIRKGSALEEAFHDIMAITEPGGKVTGKLGNEVSEKAKAMFTVTDMALPFSANTDHVQEITERYNFKQEKC